MRVIAFKRDGQVEVGALLEVWELRQYQDLVEGSHKWVGSFQHLAEDRLKEANRKVDAVLRKGGVSI
jgi:hypothetical protein